MGQRGGLTAPDARAATFAPETIDDVESVITDDELERTIYEGNARRVLALDAATLVD